MVRVAYLIQHALEVFVGCGQLGKQPLEAAPTAVSWTASEQLRETRLTTSAMRQVQLGGEVDSPHWAAPTVLYLLRRICTSHNRPKTVMKWWILWRICRSE